MREGRGGRWVGGAPRLAERGAAIAFRQQQRHAAVRHAVPQIRHRRRHKRAQRSAPQRTAATLRAPQRGARLTRARLCVRPSERRPSSQPSAVSGTSEIGRSKWAEQTRRSEQWPGGEGDRTVSAKRRTQACGWPSSSASSRSRPRCSSAATPAGMPKLTPAMAKQARPRPASPPAPACPPAHRPAAVRAQLLHFGVGARSGGGGGL